MAAPNRADVDRSPYSEGVASHSPGLPRIAATLGERSQLDLYPEGVAAFDNEDDATPFDGVQIVSAQELIKQALRLSVEDRTEVATEMLFSLSPDDSMDVDEREWIAEIQSHREEVSRGTART